MFFLWTVGFIPPPVVVVSGLGSRYAELASNIIDVLFGIVFTVGKFDVYVDFLGSPVRLFWEGFLELLEFFGPEFRWSAASEFRFEARESLIIPALEPAVAG